jgi:hypothetical protein
MQWNYLKCLSTEEPESTVAAWFKQSRVSNASTDGIHLKAKALYIAASQTKSQLRKKNQNLFNEVRER